MTETRALLVTDVVDSTALAERLGAVGAAEVWAAHDTVARRLLGEHRGREIDKTDGFLLLFESASDAVRYAAAYHVAIGALDPPLLARAGLHVGEVVLRVTPADEVALGAKPLEVDGPAKALAARVMSVAAGGRTLATAAAVEVLEPVLRARTASQGHWQLKGVTRPVELFDMDGDAPPPPDAAKAWRVVLRNEVWVPARAVPHHLPAERDAFVGRDEDLRRLAGLLDASRLVSVLGMGGAGKTRLVTRFAWTWLGDYPGGAWFCDLSDARSVDGVVAAVAHALDVPLGTDDPVIRLGHALAARGPCLVVLDNFEQVARHARDTLGRWLDRAGEARFVVTTREVLGLPGESVLALAPLASEDAVGLFVARATQAKPSFLLADDRQVVGELVRLLDGLPLAIELAAARVRVMPPKTLLHRMAERFRLLSTSGGRHTRQATLRGALDWSWDLLSLDEQDALAQLSVFDGGFTLESVEEVLALNELWPVDALQALVDKSLVRQVSGDRFDLLVTVQEYTAERLEASGRRSAAEVRHAAHFAGRGSAEALQALDGPDGVEARRLLGRDLDNLVVACRRSVARGEGALAVALVRAAWVVLDLRGPLSLALDLSARVGALPGLAPADLAAALRLRGRVLWMAGHTQQAEASCERALAASRAAGDRGNEAMALALLGQFHQGRGDLALALDRLEASLAVHRERGSLGSQGIVLGNLGSLHLDRGRLDLATACYEDALVLLSEVGDRRNEAIFRGNLGNVYSVLRLTDKALGCFEAAIVAHREVGNRRVEAVVLGNLANALRDAGRSAEALAAYEAALRVHREVGDRRHEGNVLGNLASLHLARGRSEEARVCFGAALVAVREVGDRRKESLVLAGLGELLTGLGRTDEARDHLDASLTLARELGVGRNEGWALVLLARLSTAEGDLATAASHLERAEPLLRPLGDPVLLTELFLARVAVGHREGDAQAARAALAEAERAAPPGHQESQAAIARARSLVG